jgi:hypothetical protein
METSIRDPFLFAFVCPLLFDPAFLIAGMQIFEIPPIPLGVNDLESAFDKVFREETLRKVHGDDIVSVSEWVPRISRGVKRRIVVRAPLHNNIPEEVHGFLHEVLGRKAKWIKMTTKQTIDRSNEQATSWVIHNHVSLSSIGSKFVDIVPTFNLERREDQVYLTGRIEHSVHLPPQLKRMIEDMLAEEARLYLEKYVAVLQAPKEN